MEKYSKELLQLSQIMKNILLADVMSKPAMTVFEDEDFSRVEEIFVNKGIHHLPVVNHANQIVGIISQKDVYRRIAPRRAYDGQIIFRENIIVDEDGYYEKDSLNQYILNYVMRRDPVVLKENNSLADAIDLMVRHKIGSVPIVNDSKHVVGIIARFDILKLANLGYA